MKIRQRILAYLLDKWVKSDQVPIGLPIDIIVPISYGTLREQLTIASKANVEEAIAWKNFFPNARVVFSSCSYVFPGAEILENEYKGKLLREAGETSLVASPMINSVDEAIKIKEILSKEMIQPLVILVITGELHSRSAKYIWKKVFPGARIYVVCIPYKLEVQSNHPVLSQRKMWKWVRDNLGRQIALHVLPFSIVRKIQHRTCRDS